MKTLLLNFVKDEQGQDLIEYTLLLAFVCLASAALFISAGGSVAAAAADMERSGHRGGGGAGGVHDYLCDRLFDECDD